MAACCSGGAASTRTAQAGNCSQCPSIGTQVNYKCVPILMILVLHGHQLSYSGSAISPLVYQHGQLVQQLSLQQFLQVISSHTYTQLSGNALLWRDIGCQTFTLPAGHTPIHILALLTYNTVYSVYIIIFGGRFAMALLLCYPTLNQPFSYIKVGGGNSVIY